MRQVEFPGTQSPRSESGDVGNLSRNRFVFSLEPLESDPNRFAPTFTMGNVLNAFPDAKSRLLAIGCVVAIVRKFSPLRTEPRRVFRAFLQGLARSILTI
jgi:hypothetical protein